MLRTGHEQLTFGGTGKPRPRRGVTGASRQSGTAAGSTTRRGHPASRAAPRPAVTVHAAARKPTRHTPRRAAQPTADDHHRPARDGTGSAAKRVTTQSFQVTLTIPQPGPVIALGQGGHIANACDRSRVLRDGAGGGSARRPGTWPGNTPVTARLVRRGRSRYHDGAPAASVRPTRLATMIGRARWPQVSLIVTTRLPGLFQGCGRSAAPRQRLVSARRARRSGTAAATVVRHRGRWPASWRGSAC